VVGCDAYGSTPDLALSPWSVFDLGSEHEAVGVFGGIFDVKFD
jgi:hypothetical protein